MLPVGPRPHVGATDVDLVIGVALGDETPETYRTLHTNLKGSGFKQGQLSFAWGRDVDGVTVTVRDRRSVLVGSSGRLVAQELQPGLSGGLCKHPGVWETVNYRAATLRRVPKYECTG